MKPTVLEIYVNWAYSSIMNVKLRTDSTRLLTVGSVKEFPGRNGRAIFSNYKVLLYVKEVIRTGYFVEFFSLKIKMFH